MQLARSKPLWLLLLAVGTLRLASLSLYPLMDKTEARYGEISRLMAETGNWLVPQIDYGVPFWGKPPLSIWASAISIDSFANSEFFLRLPHFLAALAVLYLVWQFAVSLGFRRRQADIAIAVPATTIGFLIVSGSVMTDMFLCLSMTMAMVGFWRGWHGERRHVYLMYAGLGFGLLAKGPIIVVLAGLVMLPWIAIDQGLKSMWGQILRRLHPASGILLMLLVAAPWFLLAEKATPGFLEYFIVGEHFQRFIDSGWKGDLYGSGHAHVRGTIWIYWFLFAFPWSLLLLIAAYRRIRDGGPGPYRDPRFAFLLLWMISPMLLFSLAGNILPTYILPGLPAVGLLVVKSFDARLLYQGRFLLAVGPVLLLILCAHITLYAGEEYSDKGLLVGKTSPDYALFYFDDRPYSAQYYSDGRARLTERFPLERRFFLAVENGTSLDEIDDYCELRALNPRRRLYFCQRGEAR